MPNGCGFLAGYAALFYSQAGMAGAALALLPPRQSVPASAPAGAVLLLPVGPPAPHVAAVVSPQAGMAVAMATVGGMGVIHYNNSLEEQLHQVGMLGLAQCSNSQPVDGLCL